MFCSRTTRLALLTLTLLATGCTKQPVKVASRLSIVPFENLSSDLNLEWMGKGIATILSNQLAGTAITPVESLTPRDADLTQTTQILQGYFVIQGGELQLKATLRDNALGQNVSVMEAKGALSAGLLPLVNSIAHQLAADARPFSSSNEQAVRQLFLATLATDQASALRYLDDAIQADPGFAAAYIGKIQVLERTGDKEKLRQTIDQAMEHLKQFPPQDRPKVELMAASISGNQEKRLEAIAAVASSNPKDPAGWKSLADAYTAAKNYKEASQALRQAAALSPNDKAIWNSLAYLSAYLGDLAGAQKSLDEYRRIDPNDANVDDSAGEVNFYLGHYADAERFFLQAHQKNSAAFSGGHLYRAALARFLTGDAKGAGELFSKYIDFRKNAKDPFLAVRSAIWQYQTGRATEAIDQLQKLGDDPAAQMQLALFYLDMGQKGKSRELAAKSLQHATGGLHNLATIAVFLTTGAANAAEWKARVNASMPNQQLAQLRAQVLGYGLFYSGLVTDAIPVWKEIYDHRAPDSSSESQTILASAYEKAGQKEEAIRLARLGIFIPKNPDPGFDVLVYPRWLALRARLSIDAK